MLFKWCLNFHTEIWAVKRPQADPLRDAALRVRAWEGQMCAAQLLMASSAPFGG